MIKIVVAVCGVKLAWIGYLRSICDIQGKASIKQACFYLFRFAVWKGKGACIVLWKRMVFER